MPFKPVGDRARWRIIYEYICSLDSFPNVYEGISYWELAGVLGTDDRRKIHEAIRRARQELERVQGLTLVSFHHSGGPAMGYWVLKHDPDRMEFSQQGKERVRSARKRMWGDCDYARTPTPWGFWCEQEINWFLGYLDEALLTCRIGIQASLDYPNWTDAQDRYEKVPPYLNAGRSFIKCMPVGFAFNLTPNELFEWVYEGKEFPKDRWTEH